MVSVLNWISFVCDMTWLACELQRIKKLLVTKPKKYIAYIFKPSIPTGYNVN